MANAQFEFPIDRWIDILSSNTPDQSALNRKVVDEIFQYDSSYHCAIIKSLKEKGPVSNKCFKVRVALVESIIRLGIRACPGSASSEDLLKGILQSAYEMEDDHLLLDGHQGMMSYYISVSKFSNAAFHAMLAIDLAEKLGSVNINIRPSVWYSLGFILFHSREYRESIKANRKALEPAEVDALSPSYRMNALNTIGLAFEKLGIPDSAFLAFDEAMAIAKQMENQYWQGLIAGNKGDVYFQLGRFDTAAVLLQYDYDQSMAVGEHHNAANSLQWLARIDLEKGLPQEALKKLRKSMALAANAYSPEYLVNTLYAFTQAFTQLNTADSVNHYMKRYLILHDSLERVAFESQADIVNMRLENNEAVNRIKALTREKKNITLIRNLSIVIIVLVSAFGYLYFNRAKLKLQLARQQALEEKRIAEADKANALEQLEAFTRNIREKTSLVEMLQEQLMTRERDEEQQQRLDQLTQHSILTDQDWEKFKRLFEKVHPGFFQSLKHQFEDITLAEQRMAAFCKLQVAPKEIANLLGISLNSVNKTRQRLRHRLNLEPEANLEHYFAGMH